jgi:hypothetical protein
VSCSAGKLSNINRVAIMVATVKSMNKFVVLNVCQQETAYVCNRRRDMRFIWAFTLFYDISLSS